MKPQGADVMTGPLKRVVTVTNPQGLHIRPAAAFAELASRFESKVTVSKSEEAVDGKFWPSLLMLAAERGTDLLLEVEGRDAPDALDALAALLSSVFEEAPPVDPTG